MIDPDPVFAGDSTPGLASWKVRSAKERRRFQIRMKELRDENVALRKRLEQEEG